MARLKRNIVANLAGSGWIALMSVALVPLYIHFMGIEAYGLVGIFITLQALLGLVDMGLSATLNREMARLSTMPNTGQTMRDLLRTLEAVFWPIALVLAAGVALLAPFIAHEWLRTASLPPEITQQALVLMGIAAALQWAFAYYSGGLLGLQRQIVLNGILVAVATLRSVGAVLILWLVSPTITAFFAWQVFVGVVQTGGGAAVLWRSLPAADRRAHLDLRLLRSTWRFAMGVAGVTVLGVILTQLDKLVLSRLLTLNAFGYYTLAAVVALSLHRLVAPIFAALYPRFTELVARGEDGALRRLYHRSSQLTVVAVVPVAVILAVFSPQVLLLWTRDPVTVEHTWLILSLLVVGTALNGLNAVPYALQLAHGWTHLAVRVNLAAVTLLGPLVMLIAPRYGGAGAAAVWIAINVGFVAFFVEGMHRRLLPHEKWRWYLEDLGLPLIASLLVAGLGRWLLPVNLGSVALAAALAGITLATVSATVLAASEFRPWLLGRIRAASAVLA